MKAPIFVDYSGDLNLFKTIEAAEGYVEAYDIAACKAYDSEGRLLSIAPAPKFSFRRDVVLKPAEELPTHGDQLRTTLIRWLTAVGESPDALEPMALSDLVAVAVRRDGKRR